MAEASGKPTISIECNLGAEDWLALLRQHRRREGRWQFLCLYGILWLLPLVYVAVFWIQVRPAGLTLSEYMRFAPEQAAGAVILPVAFYALLAWRTRRNAGRLARLEGKVSYEFSPAGWTRSTDERTSNISFSGVRRVVETDAHFFIIMEITTGAAVMADVILKQALSDERQGEALRGLFIDAVGQVVDDRKC